MDLDWDHIRKVAHANVEPPPNWPRGVRPISLEGTSLLGLDSRHQLYWDGEEIVVRRALSLTWWQTGLAIVATAATVVQAVAAVLAL